MPEIKFNLNDRIKVSLNYHGMKHLQNFHNSLVPENKKVNRSYFYNKLDEAGYLDMQAWEFLQIFGPTIVFGSATQMFHTEIIICIP